MLLTSDSDSHDLANELEHLDADGARGAWIRNITVPVRPAAVSPVWCHNKQRQSVALEFCRVLAESLTVRSSGIVRSLSGERGVVDLSPVAKHLAVHGVNLPESLPKAAVPPLNIDLVLEFSRLAPADGYIELPTFLGSLRKSMIEDWRLDIPEDQPPIRADEFRQRFISLGSIIYGRYGVHQCGIEFLNEREPDAYRRQDPTPDPQGIHHALYIQLPLPCNRSSIYHVADFSQHG